jgi:hypothetical protein
MVTIHLIEVQEHDSVNAEPGPIKAVRGLHLRPHSGSNHQLSSLAWQLDATTSSSTKGCVSVCEAKGKPNFESKY